MPNHAMQFNRFLVPFQRYGFKVISMVRRREPAAKFSMRFIALCYGSGIKASIAADQIVKSHIDTKKKSR